MNNTYKILALCLSASLMISCSVEAPTPQKKVVSKTITPKVKPRNVKPPKQVKPKTKPMLSRKALFADTLGSHNRVRAKKGLPPLKWSSQLASISQKWANTLGSGNSCKIYHHTGKVPFGENIYRSGANVWSNGVREVNSVTISNVVKAWMDEEKWYDYKRNRCQPGKPCGHYTQAVWKGTKEVGCAMKVCNDKSQTWVCSYFPAGNIVGARPY